MPSFDIVNSIDMQEVDNAINTAKKEILNRFDFRGSKTEIDLNKKDKKLTIQTEDDMKLAAVKDTILSKWVKRSLDVKSLDFKEPQDAAGATRRQEVTIIEGIEKDVGKKIQKIIKETKLKVQAAIQDDQLRVTAKSIDDLQACIQTLKEAKLDIPLQFVNMKS
jgi:uncharacterized protein YajQ (UPF0234 family)